MYIARAKRRDELVHHLTNNQVQAKVHYPIPLHLQTAAADLGYKQGDFPECERQAAEIVTLPSHQHITPEQIAFMVDTIRQFYLT